MANYDYVGPTGIFIHIFIRIGMYRNKANKNEIKGKLSRLYGWYPNCISFKFKRHIVSFKQYNNVMVIKTRITEKKLNNWM